MKKISGFKLGLGVAAAAFFAFIPNNTFAAVKIDGNDITSTTVSGATYDKSTHTITLNNYTGNKALKITESERVYIVLKGTNKVDSITSKNDIQFNTSTGSLALASGVSFTGNGIIVLDSSICASSKLTSTQQSFASKNVTISSENCKKGSSEENPDTFDMVYVYAAVLLASSAILGYRRYLAKH